MASSVDNKDIPIAELVWEDLHANVRRRVGSDNTCTELSLGGLYCNDLYSDSTHFKAVIEPRDAGSLPRRDSQRSMGLASLLSDKKVTSAKRMSALLIKEERKPLFSLMLDDNPLDRKADKRLVVNSRALVMVYNQAFLNRLVTFFTIPDELQVLGCTINP
ncbi:hypothetical protein SARC_07925 [Sphaeroforma arctica JP610]|uniref:Uncharacterized protein n=1 Tax=Sphaeroforma arctica JP610 TaxID=667725 RepID=A0A0L0FUS8_9EUKA|nr:hypothetical protein SARC_07925 [Sphaeroforma arctica JP610]KNC79688.1 hypothetical protein SARC_07925 [Sphaeroforma arctica JP610]|eukprot:XP_014153590.1 hypothetical protein SARC_07925 [Sphaeroforma arctica JP610]